MANTSAATSTLHRLAQAPLEKVLKEFSTGNEGLRAEDVAQRIKQYGLNTIESTTIRWWNILTRQFASSFVYLLLGAAVLAFVLGEVIDGGAILTFVIINAVLGFFQEYRSEQTVRLLQRYVVRRARVRRGGEETLVQSSELVPGDMVIVETGDMVPADLRLCEDHQLQADESLLTGESVPVPKSSVVHVDAAAVVPINALLSGTTIVSGRGIGVVVSTGSGTMLGEVARLTTHTSKESGFDKRLKHFSSFILRMTVLTLIVVFAMNVWLKQGETTVTELVIFSIALAVSVIPEALPVVTTFALSRGALHLAKRHVVVKRLSAIEDLGSIEVLCTDKTGTITENHLTVAATHGAQPKETLRAAALASTFFADNVKEPNNAFDLAVWHELSADEREQLTSWQRIDQVPFDPDRRRNSVLVRSGDYRRLIVRGAPEALLPLCTEFGVKDQEAFLAWSAAEGRQGHRVIALAERRLVQEESKDLTSAEHALHFLGGIAFVDPIKPTTRAAVENAKRLGIQIKIVTGDAPEVAGAVAHEVGLVASPDAVLTGAALEALSGDEQHAAVIHHHVFARVSPQQKYHIIKLLEERFAVGFLGEGINDAPALKSANVAIVVNDAADVAREAADIVLLRKSLDVIIEGIKEGRAVFANTVKYIRATLASNFGNFYAIAIASLLVDFLPMLPLQILLVNLLSDFPMISVAADSVDDAELARPHGYHIRDIAVFALVLGLVSTTFDFLYFSIFSRFGQEELRTYWFMGSILTELLFLFSVRTRFSMFKARKPAPVILWLSGLAAAITMTLPFVPTAQRIFSFVQPTLPLVLLVLGIAAVYLVITEIVKIFYFRYSDSQGKHS